MRRSITELSWNVDEPTYRANKAISYSKLSAFKKRGVKNIPYLDDPQDSESLRFGGLVDCLLTEPMELKNKYHVVNLPKISESYEKIIKGVYESTMGMYASLEDVPDDIVLKQYELAEYQARWTPKVKVSKLIEKADKYYELLASLDGRVLINKKLYDVALQCIDVLRTNPFTKDYFYDNPFDEDVERLYQLKFKINDKDLSSPVRSMFDRVICNHKNKTIQPIDLKTTGKNEEEFHESFIMWNYMIQATMYSQILQRVIAKDDYFKDFTILPFDFVVINRFTQAPLVWRFKENLLEGDWIARNGIIHKSWIKLLGELNWHLNQGEFTYPREAIENNGVMMLNNLSNMTQIGESWK